MFPHGLGTALITPFKTNKEVDYEALERLLDLQLQGGTDYLVVLGTTGEAATLTDTEKDEVQRFIVQKVAGRLPLVLGVGGNNTALVCEQARKVDTAAFSAILSVCPYYNKPNQEGLFQHFSAIAQASPLPIILYNVPGRTGVNLLPETVLRLHQAFPSTIIGIKEASGNFPQITHLINLFKNNTAFSVISGDDAIAAELMHVGAVGLISVASNAWPLWVADILRNHDASTPSAFAQRVSLLFQEGNPTGIKAVLSQMGLIQNVLRLPLVPASAELQEKLHTATIDRT